MILLTQVDDEKAESNLIDLNGELLGLVGSEVPSGTEVNGSNTDVWIWRGGRTNLHPVPQFPNWTDLNELTGLPELVFSRFKNVCGFAEDVWVGDGVLLDDDWLSPQRLKPFGKNFGRVDPILGPQPNVPVYLTECPPRGRPATEEELAALNGGVPASFGLWLPNAHRFRSSGCDSLACSRIGTLRRWSEGLRGDEFDFVQGWGMVTPSDPSEPGLISGRDVRARGAYLDSQDKGFPVWTIEMMRSLNTGNADDLEIVPGVTEYRMVIGVMDGSGKIGSGSTEIRLRFEAPRAREGLVDRC
jgi:hypothetical protein